MKNYKWVLALGGVLVMTGCSFPGQRVNENRYDVVNAQDDSSPGEYDLLRITPHALRELSDPPQSAPQANSELRESIRDYRYRVGPQDVLTFTVWDHPELTIPAGEFRAAEIQGHLVSAEGTIFFPYVGEVSVVGRTLEEIREDISERLARFIQSPQLDVRVASFRSKKVHISGQVTTPGAIPVTDVPLTLVDALTAAGGGTPEAALQRVQLVRDGTAHTFDLLALLQHGDMRQNTLLQDGDVIYVPDNSYFGVHVIGEVMAPGVVPMARGRLNLAEAITRSGGFDPENADTEHVFIFRVTSEKPRVFWLDAKSPAAMLLATQFDMQPQDVVFVASTGLARWNRLIGLILPTVQTLWQTQSFIDRLDNE